MYKQDMALKNLTSRSLRIHLIRVPSMSQIDLGVFILIEL